MAGPKPPSPRANPLPHKPSYDELQICVDDRALFRLVDDGWDWVGIEPEQGKLVVGRGMNRASENMGMIHGSGGEALHAIGRRFGYDIGGAIHRTHGGSRVKKMRDESCDASNRSRGRTTSGRPL